MDILIIGGTQFVGRHITRAALDGGHKVTLFNRGKTGPGLFPKAKNIIGDRDGGLAPLEGKKWDAVIDVCGYFPRVVEQTASLLQDTVSLYVFISTVSVYSDFSRPGIGEDSPLGQIDDPSIEEITVKSYGPLKVLCETKVIEYFPDNHLIIRPGYIVGPHDPTDRFTYWVHRVFEGGTVLVPAPPDAPMQFIDVRDLGEWVARMTSGKKTGIYNATGPNYPFTMGKLLDSAREVSKREIEFVWADSEFLLKNEIGRKEFPLWIYESELAGLMQTDCRKAIAEGLICRALSETIRDTVRWASTRPISYDWKAGLDSAREAKLIRAWKKR